MGYAPHTAAVRFIFVFFLFSRLPRIVCTHKFTVCTQYAEHPLPSSLHATTTEGSPPAPCRRGAAATCPRLRCALCCYRPSCLLHPCGRGAATSVLDSSPRLPAHSQPPRPVRRRLRSSSPLRAAAWPPYLGHTRHHDARPRAARQRPWNWSGRTSMVRLPKGVSLKSWMAWDRGEVGFKGWG